MRIDKFIVRHIEWLRGKVLLSIANNNTTAESIMDATDETMKTENMWNAVENWKGLTKQEHNLDSIDANENEENNKKEPKNKKRKITYLDDCPDWDHMSTLQRITIPILKNGSLLKGTRCDDHFIVVRETCAFDSLTQILANAIATNPTYANTYYK